MRLSAFQEEPIVLNRKKKFGGQKSKDFNCDFEFGERDVLNQDDDWVMADVMKQLKHKVEPHRTFISKFSRMESNPAVIVFIDVRQLGAVTVFYVCREL